MHLKCCVSRHRELCPSARWRYPTHCIPITNSGLSRTRPDVDTSDVDGSNPSSPEDACLISKEERELARDIESIAYGIIYMICHIGKDGPIATGGLLRTVIRATGGT